MAEQDLSRIKRNVAKMAEMGAPEEDIDGYISSEGTTVDAVRAFKFEQPKQEAPKPPTTFEKYVTQPIVQGFKDDADKVASFASQVGRNIPEGIDLAANVVAATGNALVGGKGNYFEGFMKPRDMPVSRAVDAVIGEKYQPKTTGGEVAQFAGALAGPSIVEGAAKGAVKAAPKVAGKAAEVVQMLKTPKAVNVAGEVLGGGDVAQKAKAVQDILKGQHEIASGAERAAWNQVQAQAAGKSVRLGEIPKIQQVLMDAQAESGAPILDTQLRTLNRFIDGDLPVPAETLVRMRQALSKASVKDGGLRSAVQGLDEVIAKTVDAKSLPQALAASRDRFARFVDQEAVAEAIAKEVTPETAGQLLMKDVTQGASLFDQVIKAAGSQADEAKQVMQQGIAHNLLEDAIATSSKGGDRVVSKNVLADNIFLLRSQNKSLWNKLSTRQQEGLLALASNAKKSAEGNIASNVARVVADFLGPKVSVVNRITGASEKLAPSQQMTLEKALELMKVKPPK